MSKCKKVINNFVSSCTSVVTNTMAEVGWDRKELRKAAGWSRKKIDRVLDGGITLRQFSKMLFLMGYQGNLSLSLDPSKDDDAVANDPPIEAVIEHKEDQRENDTKN